jgi:glycosyltransferase involved in cell wall biosynthesis
MKERPMRIAQVPPLFESVPPRKYGGTERVVSYLTEELVRQGHHVTLFGTADSMTAAELVPICRTGLRLSDNCVIPMAHHVLQLQRVVQRAAEFDVIHFHADLIHFPIVRSLRVPHVTTMHGRLDLPDLYPLFAEFDDVPLVSISDAQRAPIARAMWAGTVYHGMPDDWLPFDPAGGDYFAFLGRISPEKRVDRAIEIAKRVGVPLKIAAKIDADDQKYYSTIEHLFDDPLVEFIGEIDDHQKGSFLGRARALLFPIDWPEPFGLVMIEALACGTPVVAYRNGSVPEILEHGVTGFVVDDMDAAVDAARRVHELDRRRCREAFETRYSVERMTRDYLQVYRTVARADTPAMKPDDAFAISV